MKRYIFRKRFRFLHITSSFM